MRARRPCHRPVDRCLTDRLRFLTLGHILLATTMALALVLGGAATAFAGPYESALQSSTTARFPDVSPVTGARDGVIAFYDLGRSHALAAQFQPPPDVLWAQLTPMWSSGASKFPARRTTIAAGDFDGSGTTDMAVLVGLAGQTSRLVLFTSDGTSYTKDQTWTSATGALDWQGASLATADLAGDQHERLLVMYRLDDGSTAIDQFTFGGDTVGSERVLTLAAGTVAAGSRLTAGDVDGDLRDEAVIFAPSTEGTGTLTVYDLDLETNLLTAAGECSTTLPAKGARLACADTDGDGIEEVISLTSGPAGGVLTRFDCDQTPIFTWTLSTTCPQPSKAQMGCSEVTGDSMSDILLLVRRTRTTSQLLLEASTGSGVAPALYWQGPLAFGRTRFACASNPPMRPKDTLHVLSPSTMEAITDIAGDGTITFAGHPFEVTSLAPDDVINGRPAGIVVNNLFCKVTSVETQTDSILVHTTDAALSDAFDNVNIDLSQVVANAQDQNLAGTRRAAAAESKDYPKWPGAPAAVKYFAASIRGWGPYADYSKTRPAALKPWDGVSWAPYEWHLYTKPKASAHGHVSDAPSGWYKCYFARTLSPFDWHKQGDFLGTEYYAGIKADLFDNPSCRFQKNDGNLNISFYDKTTIKAWAKGSWAYSKEDVLFDEELESISLSLCDIVDIDVSANLKVTAHLDANASAKFEWEGTHIGKTYIGMSWKKKQEAEEGTAPTMPGWKNTTDPNGSAKAKMDAWIDAHLSVAVKASAVFGIIHLAKGDLYADLKAETKFFLDTTLIGSPNIWGSLDFYLTADVGASAKILWWKVGDWKKTWELYHTRFWEGSATTDKSPPSTTVTGADSAWHAKAVKLTFKATDGKGAGVAYTEASTDGGATWAKTSTDGGSTWAKGSYLTIAAPVSSSFDPTVLYRSVDKASPANHETAQTAHVKIDTRAPVTAAAGADAAWHYDPVKLTFTPDDGAVDTCSGTATTEYCIDGGAWAQGVEATLTAAGKHIVLYRSTDHAGNIAEPGRCEVKIGSDTSPPVTGVTGADALWHNHALGLDFSSTDTGGGWLDQTSGTTADLNAVDCYQDQDAWAVGAGGAIVATSDGGATWAAQTSGTTASSSAPPTKAPRGRRRRRALPPPSRPSPSRAAASAGRSATRAPCCALLTAAPPGSNRTPTPPSRCARSAPGTAST